VAADEAALLRWAQRAGELALPIFVVTLVLVLLVVAAAAWAWQHDRTRRLRRWQRSAPPLLPWGIGLAAGFAVVVGASQVFAEIAEGVQDAGALVRADEVLTAALQTHVPDAAVRVFALVTRLGDTATITSLCIVVALALVLARRHALALGWVAAVAGNGVLNTTLKQIFARVRPEHADGYVMAQGYSFPSGHSSGSLVAYGMLAYLALRLLPARWHLPAVLAASALALTIAASRVFLRVHFASDVLAGLASGAAWLTVCIASLELARRWPARGVGSRRA
jgi:undecaprenyl-diphosphatase